MRTSTLAWAAVTALSALTQAADVDEWKSRSIYQVMIDRYAHDDGSTDQTCELYKFCGGTWKGLMNKLDYIQGKTTRPADSHHHHRDPSSASYGYTR